MQPPALLHVPSITIFHPQRCRMYIMHRHLIWRSALPAPVASRPLRCGDHARALTPAECCRVAAGSKSRLRSHTATTLSLPPDARYSPSGDHCTARRANKLLSIMHHASCSMRFQASELVGRLSAVEDVHDIHKCMQGGAAMRCAALPLALPASRRPLLCASAAAAQARCPERRAVAPAVHTHMMFSCVRWQVLLRMMSSVCGCMQSCWQVTPAGAVPR